MNTNKELHEKAKAYVTDMDEKIALEMSQNNEMIHHIATCDGSNWDRTLHHYMPQIADKLRDNGFNVTSRVNHQVTDWTITLKS